MKVKFLRQLYEFRYSYEYPENHVASTNPTKWRLSNSDGLSSAIVLRNVGSISEKFTRENTCRGFLNGCLVRMKDTSHLDLHRSHGLSKPFKEYLAHIILNKLKYSDRPFDLP